jgi:hypothetical protein
LQHLWRTLVGTLSVGVAGGVIVAVARAADFASPVAVFDPGSTPQVRPVGNMQLEMGRPLQLLLRVPDVEKVIAESDAVAHALAPANRSTGSSTVTTSPVQLQGVVAHWTDGEKDRVFAFTTDSIMIDIPRGPVRIARLFLTWTPPDGRYDMRIPAAPRTFQALIGATSPILVADGTGSPEKVFLGDSVPLFVDVNAPKGLASATVHYRSKPASPFTTAPLGLASGDDRQGHWTVSLPRPEGLDTSIEYFVKLKGQSGELGSYGSEGIPFRIHLLDPTVTRDP